MKRYLVMILMLALGASSGCGSQQQSFYVSPYGSDDNVGSQTRPFASLQRAREAVAKANNYMQNDIVVYFRGGTYPVTKTIHFDSDDSGMAGHRIIYRNFRDEKVLLSGGVKITGWTQVDSSNLWRASLPSVDNTRELYIDGELAVMARGGVLPNTEWVAADDPNLTLANQTETLMTYQGSLPVYEGYQASPEYARMTNWRNISDIEMVYLQGWTYVICPIDEITATDNSGVFIKMRNPCFRDSQIKPGVHVVDPNYLQNAFALLDEPGEWYLDRSEKMLYYIPKEGQDMAKVNAVVPAIETLMELKGTLDDPVRLIQFEGLDFAYTTFLRPSTHGFSEIQATFTKDPDIDDNGHSHYIKTAAGIVVDAGQNITFERCNFSRFGAAGINIQNGSRNNLLRGCRLTEIGGSGIQIGGFNISDAHPEDEREIVKNNTINNCYLNGIGTIYKGAVGVISGYTDGTSITHNEITNIAYTGISIGWGWGYWDEGGRPHSKKNPAPDNYPIFDKPTVSRNNHVDYNHVHHVLQKLHDGGGIYTLSMMEGSTVIGNHVHDNGAGHGWPGGIYPDEASGGIEIARNAVYNIKTPYNYHEVGLPGRQDTMNLHNNVFGGTPPPRHIVEKAGLEVDYADIKNK